MASYEDILEELGRRTEASESPESLRKFLDTHETKGVMIAADSNANENKNSDKRQTLSFRPEGLTDLLVVQLMVANESTDESTDESTTTKSSAKAMAMAKKLVEILPAVYLPALAQSVSDLVTNTSAIEKISIENTPGLLRLWISLIAHAPLKVHELLSNALLVVLGRRNTTTRLLLDEATTYLVEDWKALLVNSKTSEAVRCSVVVVQWISRVPGGLEAAVSKGATELFVEMLGNFDDPLQQLSLLDSLVEEFGGDENGENNDAIQSSRSRSPSVEEWLVSPPIMSLVLQFLEDPLLSDVALRYAGVLSSIQPTELNTILEHVKRLAMDGVPTKDTERLPLVNVLSRVVASSEAGLKAVLDDPLLRLSWWDTDHIAQPKLKAAILISVAQVLPIVENSFGPAKALAIYRKLGEDHLTSTTTYDTTTQWLLQKMARSPLIEVRIASLALLAASLRITGAPLALLGIADRSSQASLIDLLLSSQREPTVHSQSARYDLLEATLDAFETTPSLLDADSTFPKNLRLLKEKLALGPHGQKPLRYGTDEPETSA